MKQIDLKILEDEIASLIKLLQKEKRSKFSCVECANQHYQILNWLIELKEYENGLIGHNKEDSTIKGYMSLEQAISHTEDVINNNSDEEIITSHTQLLHWLTTLKNYRTKNS